MLRGGVVGAILLVLAVIVLGTNLLVGKQFAQAAGTNWSTYMGSNQRSGYNGTETGFKAIASRLKLRWKFSAGGAISDQPIVVNGVMYFGAWNGNEYAIDLNGKEIWHRYLARAVPQNCTPKSAGVASSATVATVNGTQVVFVGGGDASLYALKASDGSVLWRQNLGASPKAMIWDSPALYNGKVYIGVSSYGDCPLIQGSLFQLDAATGKVLHSFSVVPDGCSGGGIWGSPTIDPKIGNGGTVFFTSGTSTTCKAGYEAHAVAVSAVNASDLSFIGSWQVPKSEQIYDDDFGSTPTLFTATINQRTYQMVGAENKNGYYYAFDRTKISNNPLWEKHLSTAPNNVSSSAWDGNTLYAAGAITVINGKTCGGSVRALDPTNGNAKWEYCAPSKVIDPVMAAPGVVVVGATRFLKVLDTTAGKELFSFYDPVVGSSFFGAATIINGMMYIGDTSGNLFAFGQ